jgi:hypothetical protein
MPVNLSDILIGTWVLIQSIDMLVNLINLMNNVKSYSHRISAQCTKNLIPSRISKAGCHDPNLGFMTKAKAWKGANHECNLGVTFALPRVWRNEPTHSQVDFHFGNWKPYGVLNFQRGILGVKTHLIKEFFMPLESSWNVDVVGVIQFINEMKLNF